MARTSTQSHHSRIGGAGNGWQRHTRRAVVVAFAVVTLLVLHFAGGGGGGESTKPIVDVPFGVPDEEGVPKATTALVSSASTPPPIVLPPLYPFGRGGETGGRVFPSETVPFPSELLAECVPQPFIPSLRVLAEAEAPRRRPPHIQRVLDEIKAFGADRFFAMSPKGSANSVAITEEDVARAEAHWIEALPPAPMGDDPRTACGGGGAKAAFHGQTAADLERRACTTSCGTRCSGA